MWPSTSTWRLHRHERNSIPRKRFILQVTVLNKSKKGQKFTIARSTSWYKHKSSQLLAERAFTFGQAENWVKWIAPGT